MQSNRKSLVFLFSVFLSSLAIAQSARHECTGIRPTPTELLIQQDEPLCRYQSYSPSCERIPKSNPDAIFIGRVVKLEKTDGLAMIDGDCSPISIETATVHVKESFSGSLPQTVTIHAGTVNGYYFHQSESALIYAYKNPDGTFSVSGCGGTKSMTEWYTNGPRANPQATEDIQYLRSRNSLQPVARIFGRVEVMLPESRSRLVPLALGFGNQNVVIDGASIRNAKTSKSGDFSFDNLAPGKYSIHVESTKPVSSSGDSVLDVQPRACAKINFYIESADDYHSALASLKKEHRKPL